MPKGETRRGLSIPLSADLYASSVASGSAPLSGLFAIDKPSGAITMKLLNSLKELLETSETFAKVETEQSGGKGQSWKKRKRNRPGSNVKLGQGGTLDPLASGVLGQYKPACTITAIAEAAARSSRAKRCYQNARQLPTWHESAYQYGTHATKLIKNP